VTDARAPRVPPLPTDQWDDDVRAGIAALRPAGATHELRQSKGGPRGINILGTLAQYPAMMEKYHTFAGHILYLNSLEPRHRELLILRVAVLGGVAYEWHQHVYIARELGVTDDELERIAQGADAAGWSKFEAALMRAVDELVVNAEMSDETWDVLACELDRHQLMDLVFTVGNYYLLAMAFLSFGVPVDSDLAAVEPPLPRPASRLRRDAQ
jgi:4-carboxymuconolactone decarboxylase